jgi:hypothetical protein
MDTMLLSPEAKEKKLAGTRAWRAKNKEHIKAYNILWRANNPDYHPQWIRDNRETRAKKARDIYRADPEAGRQKCRSQRKKNRTAYLAAAKRAREKALSTVEGRLNKRVRWRIKETLRNEMQGRAKIGTFKDKLGYSVQELLAHLESKFTKGMTREYLFSGRINIDHIKPLCAFKYSSFQDPLFKEAWALENLRPMWDIENRRRGAIHRWQMHRKEPLTI